MKGKEIGKLIEVLTEKYPVVEEIYNVVKFEGGEDNTVWITERCDGRRVLMPDEELTKEEGLERITPQPPMATAPLQGSQGERISTEAMPPCNDGEARRKLRDAWEGVVRAKVYRDVQRSIYVTGQFPLAIIAGGEYQYAFLEAEREIQLTIDGGKLWRGVPLILAGRHNKVSVVWAMDDIDLPKPPEGGFL